MIKTIYQKQEDILKAIQQLYCPNGFQCDITFGNGAFYSTLPAPFYCFDVEPLSRGVVKADSRNIPLPESAVQSVVFDPPFLTYIKSGREHNSIMGKRFSGYWKYSELEEHYRGTLKEAHRVLKVGGFLIFKCQDIIHNHKMHCTHFNVIKWALEQNLELEDLFILEAKNRIPVRAAKHGRQTQRHARIHHSYFLVFKNREA